MVKIAPPPTFGWQDPLLELCVTQKNDIRATNFLEEKKWAEFNFILTTKIAKFYPSDKQLNIYNLIMERLEGLKSLDKDEIIAAVRGSHTKKDFSLCLSKIISY